MRYPLLWLAAAVACRALLAAQAGPPFGEEALQYSVNWPSGLPVGEASFEAKRIQDRWELQFSLHAAVPGFEVEDRYRSVVSSAFCALEFEKDSRHGKKITRERTTFNAESGGAVRQTLGGGGKSNLETPPCAHDALAFFYHFRRELAAGRMPPAQTLYFGGPYQIRMEYGGRQRIRTAEEVYDADRISVSVKGKASNITFEVFLAQEPERRPVLMRVPLQGGSFVLELTP